MFHKFDQDGGKNWLPNERENFKKSPYFYFDFVGVRKTQICG
jgi:hypothetical protein